jgi:hypothetical protein
MNKGIVLSGYEPPITTVVRISNMESILASGSVTFNNKNSQPSFTDQKAWNTDEGGGSQYQGIGSDPTSNI